MTDAELLELARDGDQDAWERLVMRHQPYIYASIRRMMVDRDPEAVRDILQETWIGFVRNVQGGAPIRNIRAYVVKIAQCRVVDHIRRRQRRAQNECTSLDAPLRWDDNETGGWVEYMPAHELAVADQVAGLDTREVLETALSSLNAKERTVITARVVLGMTCKETTGILLRRKLIDDAGNTVKAAENLYYRALYHLRTALQDEIA